MWRWRQRFTRRSNVTLLPQYRFTLHAVVAVNIVCFVKNLRKISSFFPALFLNLTLWSYISVCECVCVCVYVSMLVCVFAHTYTHTHTYIYIYMCVCVCVYIYIYIYVRRAYDKFPVFFVRAFKIVIDSRKFSILLIYILWDDWPIFMISGSNESLKPQLEYTRLKPECHSW